MQIKEKTKPRYKNPLTILAIRINLANAVDQN